jgi:hypothetical protein
MNELTKIAYNCKKATYLIEKKQLGEITLKEKIELKIHLAGCTVCRTFEKQSVIISKMVKNIFQPPPGEEKNLSEEFKTELKKRIDLELKK